MAMKMKSITQRWVFNSLGMILFIIITLELILAFGVKNLYYESVRHAVSTRASSISTLLNTYAQNSAVSYSEEARLAVANFEDRDKMELMVLSTDGQVVTTSSGFLPESQEMTPDYQEAVLTGQGEYTGMVNGEKIMSITYTLPMVDRSFAALRFVVSLDQVDRQVITLIALSTVVGMAIIFFVIMSSSYFIKSIVRPLTEVGATARKIAQGDFNVRLAKKNDDEIGELCDVINYMAEELANSEKVKNDFISSVSHELRTPLTAIKGWAETLSMPGCDEEMIQKGMSVISGETQRLSQMVEELLDFSRMQSGRMKLMKGRMDLIAEISDVVLMQTERARREGKTLLYTEPEQVITLTGDKNRLRQVFVNIIDNALKYSDAGDTVTVTVEMENRHQVLVKVADTGCGIEAKDLDKVKTKFYKANTTRRGSGIGLAVADEIVRAHDGTLELQSVWGEGTTVLIRLPVERADGTQHPGME